MDTVYIDGLKDNVKNISYKTFVGKLIKRFDDRRLELCHAAMGVTGEAGELCDAIKRHAVYGKQADIHNIIEELGDLEFYMEVIREQYDITRGETLQANALKLATRYRDLEYSDEAAIARGDKAAETFNFGMTKEQQGSN